MKKGVSKEQSQSESLLPALSSLMLVNNCYAERHVASTISLQRRTASTVTTRDTGINTDVILTDEERRVLGVLTANAAGALAVVANSSHTTSSVIASPFGEVVPLGALLDALWATRYRTSVLETLQVRRQRAAAVLTKRTRQLHHILQREAQASPSKRCVSPASTAALLQLTVASDEMVPLALRAESILSNDSFTSSTAAFDTVSSCDGATTADSGERHVLAASLKGGRDGVALAQRQHQVALKAFQSIPDDRSVPSVFPLRSLRQIGRAHV